MANIKVVTVPESKEDKEISHKFEKILEDRNRAISRLFKEEPRDVELRFYFSRSQIVAMIDPNGDSMGVLSGYADGSDYIMIAHPLVVQGLLDDIDKGMLILVDYCLIKFYLCKKYFPQRTDFKMYHKYISDVLSEIASGKFQGDIAKFDIKMFSEERKYKKEQELQMILWIMLEKSGREFIFEHLDKIMKDLDIRKTVFTIYKKSFNELVSQVQKEVLEHEKKMKMIKGR